MPERKDNQILNNRPPELTEDFGITDEEQKLDQILMPDDTDLKKKTKKNEKQRRGF